jgi:outer membrane immunogenic protein
LYLKLAFLVLCFKKTTVQVIAGLNTVAGFQKPIIQAIYLRSNLSSLGGVMTIKKIGSFALAGLAFAVSAPSFAAQGYNWTGLYIGAQAGYGWAEDEIQDELISSPGVSDWSNKFDIDGATGGIFGGYNYQNGQWVFGFELDAELSNVEGDDPSWPWGDVITAEITSQGSARGRVGYVYDRALLYVTGGLAFANIETKYTTGAAQDSYDQTRSGWTLGAGVDYAFAPNWIGRFDYRYTDFREVTNHAATTDPGWNYHNDITEQAVRLGVAYKF